jgi:hypothetical protein
MRALALAGLIAAQACGVPQDPAAAATAPACEVLARAAEAAQACDADLSALADLVRRGDEQTCRRAVREVLQPPGATGRVVSVFAAAPDEPPLTGDERWAIAALPRPGRLVVRPDLPAAPGLPATRVWVDGALLSPDARGELRVELPPGAHAVRVAEAEREAEGCVEVAACEQIDLVAHGGHFAAHERLVPGPCR